MRWIVVLAVIALCGGATPARAETYFGFETGVSSAPPPPVVTLPAAPRFEVMVRSRVYVVREEPANVDLFRHDGWWYAYASGYWYRSRLARGPYQVAEVRAVPRAVLFVPMLHWQHHPDSEIATLSVAGATPRGAQKRSR